MANVQVSSGGNSGCLLFLGIPFVAFGVFFAFNSGRMLSNPHVHNPWSGVIFGGVFALFGVLMMAAGYSATKANRSAMAARAANPQQPWMWNPDWAQGRATGQSGKSLFLLWIAIAIWNAISWTAAYGIMQKPVQNAGRWIYLFIAVFPIVGAILLLAAVMQTLRELRYGKTYLQLQTLPAPLGRKLKGTIEVRLPYPLPHGINLAFSCINRVTTQSGKDRSTSDYTRWQERKNLPAEQVVAGPMGTTIPIEFDVPRDMPATNHDDPNNQLLWIVRAEADVPGVNYDELYEVPVFETRDSPAVQEWREQQVVQERLHPATAPVRPTVRISPAPEGGMEFYYAALRSPLSASVLTIFTLIFGGAEYLIIAGHGPIVMEIIFGVISFFLFIGTVNSWFGTARVVANGNGVSLHTSTLGLGGSKQWTSSEIDSIDPKVTMQTGGAKGNAWYTVTLKDLKGGEYILGKQIKDRNEAEWICEQIRQLVNLRTQGAAGSR